MSSANRDSFISSCTNKLPFFSFCLVALTRASSTVLSKVIRADVFVTTYSSTHWCQGIETTPRRGNLVHEDSRGTSLAVQGLRICLPIQEMQLRSLVGARRSHMPQGNRGRAATTEPIQHTREKPAHNERSHMPQWRSCVPQLRSDTTTKHKY